VLDPLVEGFVHTLSRIHGECKYFDTMEQALRARVRARAAARCSDWLPAGVKQVYSCLVTKHMPAASGSALYYVLPRVLVTVEPYDMELLAACSSAVLC
jgi:hypothetical protein